MEEEYMAIVLQLLQCGGSHKCVCNCPFLQHTAVESRCTVFLEVPTSDLSPCSTEVQWSRQARAERVCHTSVVCPKEHLVYHSPLHAEDQLLDECTQGNTHVLGPGVQPAADASHAY